MQDLKPITRALDASKHYLPVPKKRVKPKELTPIEIFKSVLCPSEISNYAMIGGVFGWFSNQTLPFAALGAGIGAIKESVPYVWRELLDDDAKELARQIGNIGIGILGTYAAYQSIPSSFVEGVFKAVPNAIQDFPNFLADFAKKQATDPKSLEAFIRSAMAPVAGLSSAALGLAKTTLTLAGVGDLKKLSIAAIATHLTIEAAKTIGEHRLVKPLTDTLSRFNDNRSQFAEKLFEIALILNATVNYKYFSLSSEQPIPIKPFSADTPFMESARSLLARGCQVVVYGGSQLGLGVALSTALIAHTFFNFKKPETVTPKKTEAPATLTAITELLEEILDGLDDLKQKDPDFDMKNGANRFIRFKNSLKNLTDDLQRAIREGAETIANRTRDALIAKFDPEIEDLEQEISKLDPIDYKSRLTALQFLIQTLDLKEKELTYKKFSLSAIQSNDRAVLRQVKTDILKALNKKTEALKSQKEALTEIGEASMGYLIKRPRAAHITKLIEKIEAQIQEAENRYAEIDRRAATDKTFI